MEGEGPCLVPWEKERLVRSLKAEVEFYDGRLRTAKLSNPTDPRTSEWEQRLEKAKAQLEEVDKQPTCVEEEPPASTEATPVSPLPSPPPSP